MQEPAVPPLSAALTVAVGAPGSADAGVDGAGQPLPATGAARTRDPLTAVRILPA
jgi:hypothetical protein